MYFLLMLFFYIEFMMLLGKMFSVSTLHLLAAYPICFTQGAAYTIFAELVAKLWKELLEFGPIKLVLFDSSKGLTRFIIDGSGAIYVASKYQLLKKKHRKGSIFFRKGFTGRVVISLNILSEHESQPRIDVRNVGDINPEELFPDSKVVDDMIEPAADRADAVIDGVLNSPVLELHSSLNDQDVRRIRDQLRSYLSGLFGTCHITEALTHDRRDLISVSHEFVWALVHEKYRGDAESKVNDKIKLLLVRRDELLGLNPLHGASFARMPSVVGRTLLTKRLSTLDAMRALIASDSDEPTEPNHRYLTGYLRISSPSFSATPVFRQHSSGLESWEISPFFTSQISPGTIEPLDAGP